jgi:hypothetical protein
MISEIGGIMLRENTIITLSFKELTQIIGMYFSLKLNQPTFIELNMLFTEGVVSFDVKLMTEDHISKILDLKKVGTLDE